MCHADSEQFFDALHADLKNQKQSLSKSTDLFDGELRPKPKLKIINPYEKWYNNTGPGTGGYVGLPIFLLPKITCRFGVIDNLAKVTLNPYVTVCAKKLGVFWGLWVTCKRWLQPASPKVH